MSTDAVALVKSRRIGSAATKAILFVLADYADSEWSSFASQKRIAAEAEVGERTVRRVLASLESDGIIRRERRHRADGSRTSDRLVLVRSALDGLPAALAASDGEPTGHSDRDYRPPGPNLPATVAEPTGQALAAHEPSGEPSEEPSVEPFAASRKRDFVWDAFVDVFGKPLTDKNRKRRNAHVSEITKAIAAETNRDYAEAKHDPESHAEFIRRVQAWPVVFPNATLTEDSMPKHWVTLGRPPLRATARNVKEFERDRDRESRLAAAREMDERKALEA